jgi:hypothetical protein
MWMRILAIFGAFMLLSSMVMVAQASYGLEYTFGGSNKGVRYYGQAYHGPNSAFLSVNKDDTYSRIIITLEEPLPLNMLEDFTFQTVPLTGSGDIKVKLYIDCNGDGKHKSSTGDITRQYTVYSWNNSELPTANWQEIDASLPETETCSNSRVVRMWITLYCKDKTDGSCLIDYVDINGMIASFELDEGPYEKVGKPKKISQNGKITYTITYGRGLRLSCNLRSVKDFTSTFSI